MSDAGSLRVGNVTALRGWPSARLSAQPTTSTQDREWDLLLVCTAGFVLTAVGRVHELFPSLNVVRPAIVTGLLSIVLFALDDRSSRRWTWIAGGPMTWLLLLAGWAALSIPGSLVPGHSFDYLTGEFGKTLLMTIVLAGAIRSATDVERIAGVLFWGIVLYSMVVLMRFDVTSAGDWRLGHLYYYDANDFATVSVAAMPIGIYLARRVRSWRRLLSVLALVVLSITIVRSGSRGGFLALIATAIFIVLSLRAISLGRRVAAVAIVAVVLFVFASERYWAQMGTILSKTDYNQTEETGRLQIWGRGVGYVLTHPILGVGVDNFGAAEGMLAPFASRQQYGVGVKWNAPHNTFLQVAAEMGLPALAFFIAMVVSAFRVLAPHRRPRSLPPPPVPAALKQALRASILGFMIGAMFLSLAYLEVLYILVAMAIAVRKIERRARRLAAIPATVP